MFPLKIFTPFYARQEEFVWILLETEIIIKKQNSNDFICLFDWLIDSSFKEPITSFTFQSFFVGDKVPRQNFNGGVKIYLHHAYFHTNNLFTPPPKYFFVSSIMLFGRPGLKSIMLNLVQMKINLPHN